ncbi:MAG: DUF2341 domain-containing protein [Candidatus Aenigmatarchaeota archaeon]
MPVNPIVLMYTRIKNFYIPITISNNQNISTPAPFQQLITINPSLIGSNLFSSDLGNIRFYADYAFTQPLYAWVESGNSNTATTTNIWVLLPNGIPAQSSITIYMRLENIGTEYDGIYMGEAPQLSQTYGQYDNGARVFNFYDNFTGTTPSSNWTYGGTITVNNGLFISGSSGPSSIQTTSSFGISVLDWYGYASATTGPAYWIDLGFYGSTYHESWFTYTGQNNYGYGYTITSTSTPIITYTSTPVNTYQIFTVLNSGSSAYYMLNYNLQSNSYPSQTTNVIAFRNGSSSSGEGANVYVQWVRIRAYPPNNTMPSTIVGIL